MYKGQAFSTYLSPYAFANFIGHYFKILSVLLFCQAILTIAIKSPINLLFAKLEKRQYQLKKARDEFAEYDERIGLPNPYLNALL